MTIDSSDQRAVRLGKKIAAAVDVDPPYSGVDRAALAALLGDEPTIEAVTPATGDEAGSTAVVITGTGLAATTSVLFGGSFATELEVEDDTEISVETPAGTGTVDVTVVTRFGAVVEDDGYEYTGG